MRRNRVGKIATHAVAGISAVPAILPTLRKKAPATCQGFSSARSDDRYDFFGHGTP